MTDSPKDLTESVIAGGNSVEGRGQNSEDEIAARLERELLSHYDQCVVDGKTNPILDAYDFVTHMLLKQKLRPPRIPKKNRHELGAREFTLTYSPKWFTDDFAAREAMREAMRKLIKYHQTQIINLRAVGEVGKNGASHVHCMYMLEGGRKITDKNFRRAWSYWNPDIKHGQGFQGGHHQSVKNTADFLGYIDKDIDTAWLEIKYPE